MTIDTNINELQRLRVDFEAEAGRYPDLVLTRYYMDQTLAAPNMPLKTPNHLIQLWQYIGTVTKDQVHEVLDFVKQPPIEYGLLGGALTAFAIIHGEKLDLFKRMAVRAGSLTVVADEVQARLLDALVRMFTVPATLGKNLFGTNPNPLAVWLNMVLFSLAAFQPNRFKPLTLQVDPFTASLTACDYLLESLNKVKSAQQAKVRWDETWHRLREWTSGQGPSERLAGQILLSEGYESLDPSHPLGGPDGGRDATATKDGHAWVMAAFFPLGKKKFSEIKNKFLEDLRKARKKKRGAGLAFVTNQALSNSEKNQLKQGAGRTPVELYHLERITAILDQPSMAPVRKQFLLID
jgi:hypothetical protein